MPYVRSRFIRYRRTRKYQPKRFRSLSTRSRSSYTGYRAKTSRYRRRPGRSAGRSRGHNWTGYARKAGVWASAANNALHLAKTVYALINPEFKYVDNNTLNSPFTSTSTIVNFITSIGQSTDSNGRTGNSVLLKYIKCTFNLKYNNSTNPSAIRITIVTTSTGDAPVASDIYESTGSGSAITLSPWRKNSPVSYKVWFDKLFHVDQYNPQIVYRHSIKARGHHHIKYTGAAPTSTGPGNFWALSTTDNATASIGPTRSELYRVSYLDN